MRRRWPTPRCPTAARWCATPMATTGSRRTASRSSAPSPRVQEALDDMNAAGDEGIEPGETLQEAEQELGLADWVDADTGELAEETGTRLEDH